jgi:hypothetical protein
MLNRGMSLDPDIEANVPPMKILKIAMCLSPSGGDYMTYKIFRFKEDGIWHKEPGPAFPSG